MNDFSSDENFRNWLIAKEQDPKHYTSEDRLEYEIDLHESESDDESVELFAYYMLDIALHDECKCSECNEVVRSWEDWWFDVYTGKDYFA